MTAEFTCVLPYCIIHAIIMYAYILLPLWVPYFTRSNPLKNSTASVQQTKHQRISWEEVIIYFEVVSLFTSIPAVSALRLIRDRLRQDANLPQRTNRSVSNSMRLLEFVLSNSFFTYVGCHYKQVFGCATGSPIRRTSANLVMEEVKETAISNFSHPPRWWFRYVDDSHACQQKQHMQEFHDHATLNMVNPYIQFTIETEENTRLSFLDTLTTRRNGRVQVEV